METLFEITESFQLLRPIRRNPKDPNLNPMKSRIVRRFVKLRRYSQLPNK